MIKERTFAGLQAARARARKEASSSHSWHGENTETKIDGLSKELGITKHYIGMYRPKGELGDDGKKLLENLIIKILFLEGKECR